MSLTSGTHIGLVGISGTGKSTLATKLMADIPSLQYLSLSSFVRSIAANFNMAPTRDNFAQVAARCRQRMGNGFLATFAYGAIAHDQSGLPYFVDGIRHTEEIEILRDRLAITLIGIKVDDWDLLAQRIMDRARPTDNITPEGVRTTLQREWHSASMNVAECLPLCDHIIDNSGDIARFYEQIGALQQSLYQVLIP